VVINFLLNKTHARREESDGRRSGRPKGSKNLSTLEGGKRITSLAREHTEEAINTLVRLMQHSRSDAVRATCAEKILDRGWGKPRQEIVADEDNELTIVIKGGLPD
jgi:hypothetical protein